MTKSIAAKRGEVALSVLPQFLRGILSFKTVGEPKQVRNRDNKHCNSKKIITFRIKTNISPDNLSILKKQVKKSLPLNAILEITKTEPVKSRFGDEDQDCDTILTITMDIYIPGEGLTIVDKVLVSFGCRII